MEKAHPNPVCFCCCLKDTLRRIMGQKNACVKFLNDLQNRNGLLSSECTVQVKCIQIYVVASTHHPIMTVPVACEKSLPPSAHPCNLLMEEGSCVPALLQTIRVQNAKWSEALAGSSRMGCGGGGWQNVGVCEAGALTECYWSFFSGSDESSLASPSSSMDSSYLEENR